MAEKQKEKENLFSEFSSVSTKEWEEILTRDLNGADYKEKLKWESVEGIEALPFYRKEDMEKLPHLKKSITIDTPAEWQFSEVIDNPDPIKANALATKAIEGGAESLWFTVQITANEGLLGGDITGIRIQYLDDLKSLLDGIDVKKTGIIFDSGIGSVAILALVKAYLKEIAESQSGETSEQNSSPVPGQTQEKEKQFPITFIFDPFTYMAGHGRLPLQEEGLNAVILQMASESSFKALAADGAFYHNSGATIIQELGIALAIGSEYLARVPIDQRENVSQQIWLHLSASSLYFPEIAKFRAARLLWQRILEGYKIENQSPVLIHASTSKWNKSVADPHNNMLRATTEAAAAAIGGANRIAIHPYNHHFEPTTNMSKRIARNVSHILDEEVHLSAVENPADGSYYIEVLTDEIARKAWNFFQLIEKGGGFQKAIESKFIQSEVERSKKSKDDALASQKLILTGVNHYPDGSQRLPSSLFRSMPVDSLNISEANPTIDPLRLIETLSKAFTEGAAIGDVVKSFFQPQKLLYPAIKPYRAAEQFELLRLNTQNFSKKRGKSVNVQLVPIGNKKMRKARASFSQNYLECAGFIVKNHNGFESVNEAAKVLKQSKADLIVLCGSDAEYPGMVSEFCPAFGGESVLLLAGYPKDKIDEYRNAGIDGFIYSGSNMLETLREIQEKVQALPLRGDE